MIIGAEVKLLFYWCVCPRRVRDASTMTSCNAVSRMRIGVLLEFRSTATITRQEKRFHV